LELTYKIKKITIEENDDAKAYVEFEGMTITELSDFKKGLKKLNNLLTGQKEL
jgi:hypothetical protein